MENQITVFLRSSQSSGDNNEQLTFAEGSTYQDIAEAVQDRYSGRIVLVKVRGKLRELKKQARNGDIILPITEAEADEIEFRSLKGIAGKELNLDDVRKERLGV